MNQRKFKTTHMRTFHFKPPRRFYSKKAMTAFWDDYFQKYPLHGSNQHINDLRDEWLEKQAVLNDQRLEQR